MPEDLLISVVIPAYNYAKTLPRAVESVLPQLKDCSSELIVIDDGSTDETPQVVASLLSKYPGSFRSIRKENGGLSSVRNLGIIEAEGRYLIFLDADDEMAPSALAHLKEHLDANPWTRMVIGGHCSVWEDGRRRLHIPSDLPSTSYGCLRGYLLDKTISLSNGACAMNREVFERGNYPENFKNAEDIPVFTQVLANYPCSVIKQSLAIIYKHDNSLRHQYAYDISGGISLVEEVFSYSRLGQEFQSLKNKYVVQRYLSLFRSAYVAGDKDAAKKYFTLAVKNNWLVVFKKSYSLKAIRLWIFKKTK